MRNGERDPLGERAPYAATTGFPVPLHRSGNLKNERRNRFEEPLGTKRNRPPLARPKTAKDGV